MYELTVELVETECHLAVQKDPASCRPDANGKRNVCTFEIWDRSWLNLKEVRNAKCEPAGPELESRSLKTASSPVVGLRENVTLSPDDDDVKSVASFALSRLDAFDDNAKKRLLVKVIEASSHVSILHVIARSDRHSS